MCGIIGVFNATNEILKKLPQAYIAQAGRGRDAFGIATNTDVRITDDADEFSRQLNDIVRSKEKDVLIHQLHAIVNSVPQPLRAKGTLAYNGEIYNWKELTTKNKITAKNDAELLFRSIERIDDINSESLNVLLETLDGVFAFIYWRDDKVIVCRDKVGEKPLAWHLDPATKMFAVASEGKTLKALGLVFQILEPRNVLVYDTNKKQLKEWRQRFFELHESKAAAMADGIVDELTDRLIEACRKRVQDIDDFGILFSGGIDSTVIAMICKKLNKRFTCYTAGFCDGDMDLPQDIVWAKRVSDELGLKLKIKIIKTGELDELFSQVTRIIESTDVMKTGVATPFHVCAQMAHKDGKRVMLSGLGSEELFAGYERHAETLASEGYDAVNKECLKGLHEMWRRDLYRDDMVMMHENLELRLPFLDHALVMYALGIPAEHKINSDRKKIILRDAAVLLGVPQEIASRKKQAAQYGSSFDKGLAKISKKKGFKTKAEYLQSFDMR